ncbi:MAG: hypothetical protein ACLR23_14025 [Clostridia bacterium]
MHAGEVKKAAASVQTKTNSPPAEVETAKAAEKWEEKCTPAR